MTHHVLEASPTEEPGPGPHPPGYAPWTPHPPTHSPTRCCTKGCTAPGEKTNIDAETKHRTCEQHGTRWEDGSWSCGCRKPEIQYDGKTESFSWRRGTEKVSEDEKYVHAADNEEMGEKY